MRGVSMNVNERKKGCLRPARPLCVLLLLFNTTRISPDPPKHGGRYNRYNCIAVDGGMADTACYFNSNTQAVNRRGAGRGVSG